MRINEPAPVLSRLVAAPVSGVLMVSVALLTVMVDDAAKSMEAPPELERTMAPEPDANVRAPALWAPVTATVPAPRPVTPAPKLMPSLVVVV